MEKGSIKEMGEPVSEGGAGLARRGFSEPGVEGRPSRAPCIQLGWGREWIWLSHLEM